MSDGFTPPEETACPCPLKLFKMWLKAGIKNYCLLSLMHGILKVLALMEDKWYDRKTKESFPSLCSIISHSINSSYSPQYYMVNRSRTVWTAALRCSTHSAMLSAAATWSIPIFLAAFGQWLPLQHHWIMLHPCCWSLLEWTEASDCESWLLIAATEHLRLGLKIWNRRDESMSKHKRYI